MYLVTNNSAMNKVQTKTDPMNTPTTAVTFSNLGRLLNMSPKESHLKSVNKTTTLMTKTNKIISLIRQTEDKMNSKIISLILTKMTISNLSRIMANSREMIMMPKINSTTMEVINMNRTIGERINMAMKTMVIINKIIMDKRIMMMVMASKIRVMANKDRIIMG